jgi:hypothetical protein
MARTPIALRSVPSLAATALALVLLACGDDDDATSRVASPASAADSGSAEPSEGAAPRYIIESMITSDSDRASYVAVLPTLDRSETVEFSDAREFASYAPADPWKGSLLVNDGQTPKVTQYELDDQGAWVEGPTLLFSAQTSLPLERNIAVAGDKAYVPFDRNNFIAWNPDTFEKGVELGPPAELPQQRDDDRDLQVNRGYSFELRGSTLFQPYYYADPTFNVFSRESKISVIDTKADKVMKVLTAPCPHLHITTRDKAGNIYLSNGMGSIPAAITSGGKLHNCFVKIPAGSAEIDPAATTDFRDLTDGREGSNLYVISDKLALFNVYHAERDSLGDEPDFDDVDNSANYHLWTLDLETMQAKIMDGIDYSGGQTVVFPIDDRVFVTVPAADYSSTEVYEVSAEGSAKKLFDVNGWAFKMFRLR